MILTIFPKRRGYLSATARKLAELGLAITGASEDEYGMHFTYESITRETMHNIAEYKARLGRNGSKMAITKERSAEVEVEGKL